MTTTRCLSSILPDFRATPEKHVWIKGNVVDMPKVISVKSYLTRVGVSACGEPPVYGETFHLPINSLTFYPTRLGRHCLRRRPTSTGFHGPQGSGPALLSETGGRTTSTFRGPRDLGEPCKGELGARVCVCVCAQLAMWRWLRQGFGAVGV